MTGKIAVLAVVGTLAAAAPAQARPKCGQARAAIAQVFGLYPESLDGKLWLGDCYKRGRHSVSVDTRIIGPHPARYRALVTREPGEAYHISVRPK